ncbi:MAG: class I SAM-dependent DNA methyltransferase, partial [Desulfamplus sp.]|nr:class I SAM-dependent DNA methyltransferase [Desulfamplus sp.]
MKQQTNNPVPNFFLASAEDFKKIPGSPIAYWVPNFDVFNFNKISEKWFSGGRLKTHDGQRYIRFIWEPNRYNARWKRIIKGGDYRKHFGNEDFLVDWSDEAILFYEEHGGLYQEKYREREGVCWSKITSARQSFRIKRSITEYDSASPTIFNEGFKCDYFILALLNSPVCQFLLKTINPTLNTQVADVMAIPVCQVSADERSAIEKSEKTIVDISFSDWNLLETSWDFGIFALFESAHRFPTIKETFNALRTNWRNITYEIQSLEEENNRIFIESYGLQDHFIPDVPLSEITLTCNPHYRYGGDKTEEELEALLQTDTIKELISYAIGCMMGRYSLNEPGLIYAHSGN